MPDLSRLLENAEVLGKMNEGQKQHLAKMAVRRMMKAGETLYIQGDLWKNVLLIASGRLQAAIYSTDGRSYIIAPWESGEEFWPHCLFDDEPMPSTMEVARDCVFYQWDGEDILKILIENPAAIRALLSRQVRLIRKRRDTIADLAFQPVTGRLAKLLLERIPAEETSAQRDLTLDQIASMVATSPEVVCRTLYSLQRTGLLKVTRASITLNDRAGLERLVGKD